jgi:hypothetical protein
MSHTPPTLDNPSVYVGVLAGRDDVTVVLNPGTTQEQRICLAPLVALAVAGEIGKYAQRQIERQAATLQRYDHNSAQAPRPKLDS